MYLSVGHPVTRALQERHDQGCPTGLVAGAETSAGIPVEVLVEEQAVAPMRIGLQEHLFAENRTTTIRTAPEDSDEASGKIVGDAAEREVHAGAGRMLDHEIITVIAIELP
jgi:hypothetical protein